MILTKAILNRVPKAGNLSYTGTLKAVTVTDPVDYFHGFITDGSVGQLVMDAYSALVIVYFAQKMQNAEHEPAVVDVDGNPIVRGTCLLFKCEHGHPVDMDNQELSALISQHGFMSVDLPDKKKKVWRVLENAEVKC